MSTARLEPITGYVASNQCLNTQQHAHRFSRVNHYTIIGMRTPKLGQAAIKIANEKSANVRSSQIYELAMGTRRATQGSSIRYLSVLRGNMGLNL